MSAPDILFKGIPRGNTRGYTADTISTFKPDWVVIPCCGSFSLARVALAAGVRPNQIVCGDISLYSTVIGNLITNTEFRLDLTDHAKEHYPLLQDYFTDPLSKAASVLFMIRVLQHETAKKTVFHQDIQRELWYSAPSYFLQLKEQLLLMQAEFRGLQYHAQDMWITLDQYKDDPKAILLTNPPRYDGGYDRMFKGIDDCFSWDQPEAEMFREKDYDRLMELLAPCPALTLMYYATQGEDPAPQWGEPWRSVFADRPGNRAMAAINWIVANQTVEAPIATMSKLPDIKGKYPLFAGEIKDDTLLTAMKIDKNVGDYYRDLFIHKLPGSMTERYVGLFLDGYLFAVVGLHVKAFRSASLRSKQGGVVHLTFAFTVPHEKYARLHKLTLMSIVSSWFWYSTLLHEGGFDLLGLPKAIHSVMLTPHPENKTARGIMYLIDREKQKDGTYKLRYTATIKSRSYKDTVALWLKKYSQVT